MNSALKYALVLLAASAGHRALAWQSMPGSTQFFVGNTAAHGQGYLGVDIRDVSPDQAAALHLRNGSGAEIVLVDHDAPAGKAGLREHDVVLELNGQAVTGEEQVRRMLRELPPGRSIVLLINRSGQQITVSTQMTTREAVEREAWEEHLAGAGNATDPGESHDSSLTSSAAQPAPHGNSFLGAMLLSPSYTGAMLEKMSDQLATFFGVPSGGGLLVRSVQPNSPAAHAGMQAGDVVLRANNRDVTTTADWTKAIKTSHGHPLTIVVLRERRQQTLTLTPDDKKRL